MAVKRIIILFLTMFWAAFLATAAEIPFTGELGITSAQEYSANLTGPSFSMFGETADAEYVVGCLPGETCTIDAHFLMFLSFVDNIEASVDGVTGLVGDGEIDLYTTYAAPAFDPATWSTDGYGGYWTNIDAGSTQFSGYALGYGCVHLDSCPPVGSAAFELSFTGTATAYLTEMPNGNVIHAYYEDVSGIATITYLDDPTPEPCSFILLGSGLLLIGFLTFFLRKNLLYARNHRKFELEQSRLFR